MKTSVNRKTLLLSFLLLATGSAWAGWEKLATTTDATFHADRATIRKDGNLRKMWELKNFKPRRKDGAMSELSRTEYDCKGERLMLLTLSGHTEPMGGGKVLFNDAPDPQWDEIAPRSVAAAFLKIACAQ